MRVGSPENRGAAGGPPSSSRSRDRVSIVTPSFNQAPFLRECLASVGGQSYPDVEHVVADGGSTDGTVTVLAEWANVPVRRYLSEPDCGMYDALNKGFQLASGNLFAYLNCDDLYFPYSLEVLVQAHRQSGADVVYGDMLRLYDDGRVVFKLQPDWDPAFYGQYYQLAQPATLWTRELFETLGGFDHSYRYGGDADFFMRAATSGARFVRIDEVVCVERHRAGSLSAAFQDRHREEILKAVRSHRSTGRNVAREMARVLRALGRQTLLAACLGREFRSRAPRRWPRFFETGLLESLSVTKLLVNVIPAPLLPRKLSVGRVSVGGLLKRAGCP